jgi:hypothetical protein
MLLPPIPVFFTFYSPNPSTGIGPYITPTSQPRLAPIFKPKRKLFNAGKHLIFKSEMLTI